MPPIDLFKEKHMPPRELERMLVALGPDSEAFVVACKGFVMESDRSDNSFKLIDEMGIPLPENGIPGILVVFESYPYYTRSVYDSYNGDYDGGEPVYDDPTCKPRWRTLSDAEWRFVIRGDLDGLLASWTDVNAWEEEEPSTDPEEADTVDTKETDGQ